MDGGRSAKGRCRFHDRHRQYFGRNGREEPKPQDVVSERREAPKKNVRPHQQDLYGNRGLHGGDFSREEWPDRDEMHHQRDFNRSYRNHRPDKEDFYRNERPNRNFMSFQKHFNTIYGRQNLNACYAHRGRNEEDSYRREWPNRNLRPHQQGLNGSFRNHGRDDKESRTNGRTRKVRPHQQDFRPQSYRNHPPDERDSCGGEWRDDGKRYSQRRSQDYYDTSEKRGTFRNRNLPSNREFLMQIKSIDTPLTVPLEVTTLLRVDGKIVSRLRYSALSFFLPSRMKIINIRDLESTEELMKLLASCHQYYLSCFAEDREHVAEWEKLMASLYHGRNRVAVCASYKQHDFYIFPPPCFPCRCLTLGYKKSETKCAMGIPPPFPPARIHKAEALWVPKEPQINQKRPQTMEQLPSDKLTYTKAKQTNNQSNAEASSSDNIPQTPSTVVSAKMQENYERSSNYGRSSRSTFGETGAKDKHTAFTVCKDSTPKKSIREEDQDLHMDSADDLTPRKSMKEVTIEHLLPRQGDPLQLPSPEHSKSFQQQNDAHSVFSLSLPSNSANVAESTSAKGSGSSPRDGLIEDLLPPAGDPLLLSPSEYSQDLEGQSNVHTHKRRSLSLSAPPANSASSSRSEYWGSSPDNVLQEENQNVNVLQDQSNLPRDNQIVNQLSLSKDFVDSLFADVLSEDNTSDSISVDSSRSSEENDALLEENQNVHNELHSKRSLLEENQNAYQMSLDNQIANQMFPSNDFASEDRNFNNCSSEKGIEDLLPASGDPMLLPPSDYNKHLQKQNDAHTYELGSLSLSLHSSHALDSISVDSSRSSRENNDLLEENRNVNNVLQSEGNLPEENQSSNPMFIDDFLLENVEEENGFQGNQNVTESCDTLFDDSPRENQISNQISPSKDLLDDLLARVLSEDKTSDSIIFESSRSSLENDDLLEENQNVSNELQDETDLLEEHQNANEMSLDEILLDDVQEESNFQGNQKVTESCNMLLDDFLDEMPNQVDAVEEKDSSSNSSKHIQRSSLSEDSDNDSFSGSCKPSTESSSAPPDRSYPSENSTTSSSSHKISVPPSNKSQESSSSSSISSKGFSNNSSFLKNSKPSSPSSSSSSLSSNKKKKKSSSSKSDRKTSSSSSKHSGRSSSNAFSIDSLQEQPKEKELPYLSMMIREEGHAKTSDTESEAKVKMIDTQSESESKSKSVTSKYSNRKKRQSGSPSDSNESPSRKGRTN